MALLHRTCILELKTEQERIFMLKASNPMVLQQCTQRVQGVIERFETMPVESKKKKFYLNTAKVNEEDPSTILHNSTTDMPILPTPEGKRDYDMSASSLQQK